jgi:NAD(P)-dependent dehydrogenase (short-subunit alcohol dehydrogenase family)
MRAGGMAGVHQPHPKLAYGLQALADAHATVSLHRLDVTNVEQVQVLQVDMEESSIDVLANNASVYLDEFAGDFGGSISRHGGVRSRSTR